MKKIIAIICSVLLTSCSTGFYQVYETKSENNTPNSLFEDANCRIEYNLWAEGGNAGFSFYNKTDAPITLDLSQSFFVLNGIAYDYFLSRTFSNSSSITKNSGATTYFYGIAFRQGSGFSSQTSVETEEKQFVTIPPHTRKIISEYKINDKYFSHCDLVSYPTKRQIKTVNFDKENSPYVFQNHITYVANAKPVTVSNAFYISSITNYPSSEAYETKNVTVCDKKRITKVPKMERKESFYITYGMK